MSYLVSGSEIGKATYKSMLLILCGIGYYFTDLRYFFDVTV